MPRFDAKEPGTIVAYADKLEEFWNPRNQLMIEWQDLRNLQPTIEYELGHERVTENTPAIVTSYAVAVMSLNRPQHRIPYEYGPADSPQREARSGALERFLIGAWNHVDSEQRKRRRAPFHQELAYWACLRGWVAGVVAWTAEPPFPYQVRLWDPLHVYPDPDLPELVVRRYRRSHASVVEEYPRFERLLQQKTGSADCDVCEVWWGERHGVVIDGMWAKRFTQHGLDRPPIIVLPVGGYPIRSAATRLTGNSATRVQLGDNAWVKYVGESVLFAMNETQRYANKLASQVADVFNYYANPIPVSNTEDGKPIDATIDPGDIVGLKIGESLRFERPPGLPGDLASWISRQQQQIEKATFPSVMFGNTPHALTGFARSLIHVAGNMKVSPPLIACTDFYKESDALLLEQLEKLAAPLQMQLRGRDYADKVFSEVVDLYNLRDLVGGDYEVQPELKPFLPQDLPAAVAMSAQLRAQRTWSRKTINEKLFADHVQDAVGEEQRLTEEAMQDNPEAIALFARGSAFITAMRKYRAMLDAGRITSEEYEMVRQFTENEMRGQTALQRRMLMDIGGPGGPPGPAGMPRGPGGIPQGPEAFPADQRPGQEGLPPEILAAQLQGAESPPGRPPGMGSEFG